MPSRAMMHTGRTLFHLHARDRTIPEEHISAGRAGRRTDMKHGARANGTTHGIVCAQLHRRRRNFFGGMDDHWNVPANHYDRSGDYPAPPQVKVRWLLERSDLTVKR